MFERFTEKARRVIFFARYEASELGGLEIEPEHILLGLAREDPALQGRFNSTEWLRKQLESQTPNRDKLSTSVDMPVSHGVQLVFRYAADEAATLHHQLIDCGHLVLGLLRIKDGLAANFLQQHGIHYETYREVVGMAATPVLHPVEEEQPKAPSASSLQPAITALCGLLDQAAHFDVDSQAYGDQQLKRKPWSRKEALGHLIDLAAAHQQWTAHVFSEPRLTIAAYPQDDWVRAQQYQNFSWPDAIELWVGMNRLLIHVLLLIPEEKTRTPVRIGVEQPISFLQLIERYVSLCDDILGQMLSRL